MQKKKVIAQITKMNNNGMEPPALRCAQYPSLNAANPCSKHGYKLVKTVAGINAPASIVPMDTRFLKAIRLRQMAAVRTTADMMANSKNNIVA